MEQLVARRAHNPKVTGSSPVPATIEKETLSLKKLRVFCLTKLLKVVTTACVLYPYVPWFGTFAPMNMYSCIGSFCVNCPPSLIFS